MVATGLPIASPPAQGVTAVNTDAQAPVEAADGGFLGTLLQMLGLQEPAQAISAGAAGLITDQVGDEDSNTPVESADAETVALAGAAIVPIIQPVEIRSAQLLVRDSTDEIANPVAGTIDGELASGASSATVADDATRQLLSLLKDSVVGLQQGASTEVSAQAMPPGSLQPPSQEASLSRTMPTEVAVPRQLHAHVGTPAWTDELGAQLHMLAEKGHSAASLRLSPEHLGPLEVQISVQDNEATVWFGAANGDTRAALEQALPRLRELFAAQGMSLSQSGVFNQSQRDSSRHAGG